MSVLMRVVVSLSLLTGSKGVHFLGTQNVASTDSAVTLGTSVDCMDYTVLYTGGPAHSLVDAACKIGEAPFYADVDNDFVHICLPPVQRVLTKYYEIFISCQDMKKYSVLSTPGATYMLTTVSQPSLELQYQVSYSQPASGGGIQTKLQTKQKCDDGTHVPYYFAIADPNTHENRIADLSFLQSHHCRIGYDDAGDHGLVNTETCTNEGRVCLPATFDLSSAHFTCVGNFTYDQFKKIYEKTITFWNMTETHTEEYTLGNFEIKGKNIIFWNMKETHTVETAHVGA